MAQDTQGSVELRTTRRQFDGPLGRVRQRWSTWLENLIIMCSDPAGDVMGYSLVLDLIEVSREAEGTLKAKVSYWRRLHPERMPNNDDIQNLERVWARYKGSDVPSPGPRADAWRYLTDNSLADVFAEIAPHWKRTGLECNNDRPDPEEYLACGPNNAPFDLREGNRVRPVTLQGLLDILSCTSRGNVADIAFVYGSSNWSEPGSGGKGQRLFALSCDALFNTELALDLSEAFRERYGKRLHATSHLDAYMLDGCIQKASANGVERRPHIITLGSGSVNRFTEAVISFYLEGDKPRFQPCFEKPRSSYPILSKKWLKRYPSDREGIGFMVAVANPWWPDRLVIICAGRSGYATAAAVALLRHYVNVIREFGFVDRRELNMRDAHVPGRLFHVKPAGKLVNQSGPAIKKNRSATSDSEEKARPEVWQGPEAPELVRHPWHFLE